jgi:hypothetical protein
MVMPPLHQCPHDKSAWCSRVAPCRGCEKNETVEDDLKSIARLAQENEKLAAQKTNFRGSKFFGARQGETK